MCHIKIAEADYCLVIEFTCSETWLNSDNDNDDVTDHNFIFEDELRVMISTHDLHYLSNRQKIALSHEEFLLS